MQHDPTGQRYRFQFNNRKRKSQDWPNFLYIDHCGWAISWEKGFWNGSEEDWWNKENIQNKDSCDLFFLETSPFFYQWTKIYKFWLILQWSHEQNTTRTVPNRGSETYPHRCCLDMTSTDARPFPSIRISLCLSPMSPTPYSSQSDWVSNSEILFSRQLKGRTITINSTISKRTNPAVISSVIFFK